MREKVMRLMQSPRVWVGALLVVIGGALLWTPVHQWFTPQCQQETSFSGVIARLPAPVSAGAVAIFAQGTHQISIVAKITASTRIYQQRGGECVLVSFQALRVGETVKLWNVDAGISTVYPTTFEASAIVIVYG